MEVVMELLLWLAVALVLVIVAFSVLREK